MPKIRIKGKTIHIPYTKAGLKVTAKLRKKKKKKKKNNTKYGQIPTGSAPENPVGGN